MADKPEAAPKSLEDFFAKTKKKKIKGSNLNTEAIKTPGDEQKGKAAKDKDDANDEEEEKRDTGLKVQVAGKLLREDDKKDEADHSAPVWKTSKATEPKTELDAKRYPTLRKAVGQSSNINMHDGSATEVNIKTHKNAFQALNDEEDDDDEGARKGPKEIKPFQATKQKGEMVSSMIQREVEKHGGIKGTPAVQEKKKKKKKEKEVSSSEDEDSADEEEKEEARKKKEAEAKKKAKKQEEENQEDVKIQPDLEESRRKYQGRQKLPKRKLPPSELEAEKEIKPLKATVGVAAKKGKKGFVEEEEENTKSKLLVAPDDWVPKSK